MIRAALARTRQGAEKKEKKEKEKPPPPPVYQKPKPQANVMLSDLFDIAFKPPAKKKADAHRAEGAGSKPDGKTTVTISAQHRQTKVSTQAFVPSASKLERVTSGPPDRRAAPVIGLAGTQHRGKEKATPKKKRRASALLERGTQNAAGRHLQPHRNQPSSPARATEDLASFTPWVAALAR